MIWADTIKYLQIQFIFNARMQKEECSTFILLLDGIYIWIEDFQRSAKALQAPVGIGKTWTQIRM
jgi:hypothetical protein